MNYTVSYDPKMSYNRFLKFMSSIQNRTPGMCHDLDEFEDYITNLEADMLKITLTIKDHEDIQPFRDLMSQFMKINKLVSKIRFAIEELEQYHVIGAKFDPLHT